MTINSPGDVNSIGNWATVRSLTVNVSGLTINVPAGNYDTFTINSAGSKLVFGSGTYNFANTLVLNNGTALETSAPATINIGASLSMNGGKQLLGQGVQPHSVILNILGGLMVNSNSELNGDVRSPNGTVTLNGGNAAIKGNIWANAFTLNTNSSVVCSYCMN